MPVQLNSTGDGRLDRMKLRECAYFHRDRSKKGNDKEIESRSSNIYRFQITIFWPSDMPPFPLVPCGPLGPPMFPSC